MEKYINVLKCIVKNFNIIENNDFDDIIKNIIDKILDNYDKNSYFIKKFSKKYYYLNKNDSIVKMIITIQYDFKKSTIRRILYDHKFKNINEIADYIYLLKQKGYRRYIESVIFNKCLERVDSKLVKEILHDIYIKY